MKEKIQHRLFVLAALLVLVGGISLFLNNASYNPNFSVLDAITGATKKTQHSEAKDEIVPAWGYTTDDIALSEKDYVEEKIVTEKNTYKVLKN